MSASTPEHHNSPSPSQRAQLLVRIAEKVSWTAEEAAIMNGITTSTYYSWVQKGIMPSPIKGTTRYSSAAVRQAAERGSGLQSTPEAPKDALDRWEAEND